MNLVDLRSCLESWPYDSEKNVLIGRGADGREIILIRLPMGLEQYEIDGRPDGQRVHGEESALDFHRSRIGAAIQNGSAAAAELTAADCAEIFHEASSFYHRLVFLFCLKDWMRVERDAAHVLGLIELARQHARCAEDRVQLDPWRSHITRIHAVARAMIFLDQRQRGDAVKIVRTFIGAPAVVNEGAQDDGTLAEFLLESARDSLTICPAFHPRDESSFVRQDDYRMIRYHGHTAFLKSTRGFHCLARLLRTPGREFHVSELLVAVPDGPVAAMARDGLQDDAAQFVTAGLYDGSAILDGQAKAECKRRLTELRHDLEEAEHFNDPNRAAKVRVEIDAISEHLSTAFGLGGRDRKTSSEAERARSTVTKRIKQTVQKIGDAIPTLGHHLAVRIKTGYFCSYSPHPDRPVAWKF